ncbi:MAG TPA: hypothetical protein VK688_07720, partial [Gemmatimonadales bacterium]|nr:hypothetical protein [Gemmatimonadales bacterium]
MTIPLTRLFSCAAMALSLLAGVAAAQTPSLSPETQAFVKVNAATTALIHARVIDGTGATPRTNQT